MPTRRKTPWPAEWWHGPIGEQWYYTRAEIKAIEKRLAATAEASGTPKLKLLRTCVACRTTFESERNAPTRCPRCQRATDAAKKAGVA